MHSCSHCSPLAHVSESTPLYFVSIHMTDTLVLLYHRHRLIPIHSYRCSNHGKTNKTPTKIKQITWIYLEPNIKRQWHWLTFSYYILFIELQQIQRSFFLLSSRSRSLSLFLSRFLALSLLLSKSLSHSFVSAIWFLGTCVCSMLLWYFRVQFTHVIKKKTNSFTLCSHDNYSCYIWKEIQTKIYIDI